MTPTLSIAIGQLNPTIGDLQGNTALMLAAARQAERDGADLVVFPELSLTGYSPADLLDDADFVRRLRVASEALRAASRATPALHWVVGLPVERQAAGGKRFYNALQVLRDGQVVLEQYKQLLPTYGVFDEGRHFAPGPDAAPVLRIGMARVGFLVCEDGWNDAGADYPVNPCQRLADAAVDLVVSINASPSQKGKRQQRHAVFSKACARHGLALLYVAQVGGHDQLVYDGGSFAVEPDGRIVHEAARFAPALDTLRFDIATRRFGRADGAALADVDAAGLPVLAFYRQQIVLGLRDYARRCGFTQVLVGCSGGIDSALTLALAVEAMGTSNVVAITMPSLYSSAGSVADSVALCRRLGIALLQVPIQDIVAQVSATLHGAIGERPHGLALENLQARTRGTLLMTYSNQYGQLLLTTGNKSELSVGYCTLYGDTNGGLGLIGDLYKTEVFALARHLNATAGRELIPAAILDKAPSAELAPGQQDSDSLPPYEVLDEILKLLIEGELLEPDEHRAAHAAVRALAATAEGAATIARTKALIARSEYKRRQAPPIIRLRARAFGNGRQLPIAARPY
ncbi:NAD+ synthase [Pseudorhodoferax sp.]|uniref:NAD+ synthase n=1 Tax=Pseudorhodoferax sp. TaxID=1993553 RepID=UPI002DD67836|nr:NAD+ synthase [Pseudorhodoferax sp.]